MKKVIFAIGLLLSGCFTQPLYNEYVRKPGEEQCDSSKNNRLDYLKERSEDMTDAEFNKEMESIKRAHEECMAKLDKDFWEQYNTLGRMGVANSTHCIAGTCTTYDENGNPVHSTTFHP